MKKFIILFGLILLTGCKKEQTHLECTMQESQDENTIVQTIIVDFKKEDVSNLNIKTETKLAEKYLEQIDVFEEGIKSNFSDYADKNGITMENSKTDNSIILNIKIDVVNLDDDMKNKLGIVNTYSNYNDTKEKLEKNGYTCN